MRVKFTHNGKDTMFTVYMRDDEDRIKKVTEEEFTNLTSNLEIALKAANFEELIVKKEVYIKLYNKFLTVNFIIEYERNPNGDFDVKKNVELNTDIESNKWFDDLKPTDGFIKELVSTIIQAQMGILGKDLLQPIQVEVFNTRNKDDRNVH